MEIKKHDRDLMIYGLWTTSNLKQEEIGNLFGIGRRHINRIIAQKSNTITTIRKKGYQIIRQIVAGLFLMINEQGDFICFNPNEHSRAAFEMWRVHTDDRLRQRISEGLVTK